MEEIWKDIVGYEGLYQVSNLGRVKNLKRMVRNRYGYREVEENILKYKVHRKYNYAALNRNGTSKFYRVHRLVAMAFIPNKLDFKYIDEEDRLKYINNLDMLEVNHKDKNTQNNRIDNLEWCTRRYNVNYKK